MDKKTVNGNTGYAALPGLETEQVKLLCLVAYLGDIPGDYVLKQLYGRNCSKAKTDLVILEHSQYVQDGRVSPRVFFNVVAVALDNFDIPRWVEKTCQFRTDTASWLSLIHISEPTRRSDKSRMPSSA